MQQALSALVLVGILIWGFLLYQDTHPVDVVGKFDNAETSSRCAQYGYDVEGQQNLGYGDRIKQLMHGCW